MSSNVCLVYSTFNSERFAVPRLVGDPTETQMVGTPLELLAELAGRVQSGSLGYGLSSKEYFAQFKKARAYDCCAHSTFTVEFKEWGARWTEALLNRRGVYFERVNGLPRLTVSLKALVEWSNTPSALGLTIQDELMAHGARLAPQLIAARGLTMRSRVVSPLSTGEVWASVFVDASTAWVKHLLNTELVVSARSSRIVTEEDTPSYWAPELMDLLKETFDAGQTEQVFELLQMSKDAGVLAYQALCSYLTAHNFSEVEAGSIASLALQQSTGCQALLSGSLKTWQQLLAERTSPFSDIEDRAVFRKIRTIIFGEPHDVNEN